MNFGHPISRAFRAFAGVAFLSTVALASTIACSSKTTRPHAAALQGQVVDPGGRAVAGAAVAVFFNLASPLSPVPVGSHYPDSVCAGCNGFGRYLYLRNNPFVWSLDILFAIPSAADVRLTVRDREHEVVRSLLDGPRVAGVHQVTWDGTDDDGHGLPNGLYQIVWTDDEGDSIFTQSEYVLCDRLLASLGPNAVTDAAGRFSIQLAELPIGSVIEGRDAEGNGLGDVTVTSNVRVCASRAPGDSTGSNAVDIDLGDLQHSVSANVQLTR